MSTQVAKPVQVWQPRVYHGHQSVLKSPIIAFVKSCRSPTGRPGKKLEVMSDADTEESFTPYRRDDLWRNNSVTSTESEGGGPHIVIVHPTGKDEEDIDGEDYDADLSDQLHSPYLLSVLGVESVTSTDVGSDCTSEGCDSSQEVDVQSITPELKASLVKQLEDYLSDEGLANDLFLLKHVKRHRDGYVSLKLLSGYKKIKKISRDWRVLSLVLKESSLLQVNEEGTKVRRLSPLPPSLLYDAPASRALVAINVPHKHATMGGLATLFGAYGGVASLQVIRPKPGGGVPPELQSLLTRLPEVATTISAVVEYEDVWGAAKALQELSNPPMTLHVLKRSRKSERPSARSSRNSPVPTAAPKGRSKFENGVSPEELRLRLRGNGSRQRSSRRESSGSEGEDVGASGERRGNGGALSWRQGHPHLTPQSSPRSHYRRPMGNSISTPSSPSLFRRSNQKHQFGVLRDPKGPDGTRGFARTHS